MLSIPFSAFRCEDYSCDALRAEIYTLQTGIPMMCTPRLVGSFFPILTALATGVAQEMEPYSGHHESGVDPSTLTGKVMCGYQGWFAAEGDGSGRGWFHYAPGHNAPEPGNCTFDLWPDMSEMDADEKFPTAFTYEDGSTAHLFSPYKKKTVVRHFQWMKEYGIDGIFLQRFRLLAPVDDKL